MINWIVKNKFVIGFAILGLIAGFLLNKWANKLSEDKIIAAIKAEIESLKQGRLTQASQTKLIELEAQLALLQ